MIMVELVKFVCFGFLELMVGMGFVVSRWFLFCSCCKCFRCFGCMFRCFFNEFLIFCVKIIYYIIF